MDEKFAAEELDRLIAWYERDLKEETRASENVKRTWRIVIWALKIAREITTNDGP